MKRLILAKSVLILVLVMTCHSSVGAQDVHASRPISDAQFKKLLGDLETNGFVGTISSPITTALGLTRQDQTLTVRQDPFLDSKKGAHAFIKLDNGNYLFETTNAENTLVRTYYVAKDLVLIVAVVAVIHGTISIMPKKDAQKGLEGELRFFSGIADGL
jgi:hypothetical protein